MSSLRACVLGPDHVPKTSQRFSNLSFESDSNTLSNGPGVRQWWLKFIVARIMLIWTVYMQAQSQTTSATPRMETARERR